MFGVVIIIVLVVGWWLAYRERHQKMLKCDLQILFDKLGNDPGLTMELQYILSSLRGPDRDINNKEIDSHTLKWYTTARLRSIVTPHYVGDINFTPLSPVEIENRNKLLERADGHFVDHWNVAVLAVKTIYNYDLHKERRNEND